MIRNDDHLDTRNRSSPAHKQITGEPARAINPTIRRALSVPVPKNPKRCRAPNSRRCYSSSRRRRRSCRRGCTPLSSSTSVTATSADILKTVNDKLPNDLEGMEASTKRLYALIDDIYKYVDDVVEGRAAPDNDIGRFLANALASVLKISATDFDNVFNERIQSA
ncbi:hypothetical protein MUK42_27621 [Musa troglodytarum]|uniref:EIF3F/CSN6-like C-terminal domain-containing protein n=1 Tax=Musa troglodytarum TaxID=320322 RepID=A0A9E7F794_9LILI|nr:hypothetical protein MUK42_27621 [Musa troglodytarum]